MAMAVSKLFLLYSVLTFALDHSCEQHGFQHGIPLVTNHLKFL